MAMNSGALGILSSSSPRWKLGGFPAGRVRDPRASSPHRMGMARLLLGQVSVVCEAGRESATEGQGQRDL